jgi:hypothetical protein
VPQNDYYAYGYGQPDPYAQQQPPQQQQEAQIGYEPQQQAVQQGQTVAAGYGYVENSPIPNPGGSVQLSPIVIPVSFVPYTTQNQPLYQVETVMPEKGYIKHRGVALFMLALSVALIIIILAFPVISGYSGLEIISALFKGQSAQLGENTGFEFYFRFQIPQVIMVGSHLAAVTVILILLVLAYNVVKYIVKSITGKVKRRPYKANVLLLVLALVLLAAIILMNITTTRGAFDSIILSLQNSEELLFRMSFGMYVLFGISVALILANAFIVTEKYLPVEGALPEEK